MGITKKVPLGVLVKNKNLVGKLLYGKIFHYLLEYYLKYGKWINNYEEFKKFILESIKRDFYLIQLSEDNLEEVLRIYWTRYANKKPINLIRLFDEIRKHGYRVEVEYPIVKIRSDNKSDKFKVENYFIDVLIYHPERKEAYVIEIKTGTKRRKRSANKQAYTYEEFLKEVPYFRNYKISSYIYWLRKADFCKYRKKCPKKPSGLINSF